MNRRTISKGVVAFSVLAMARRRIAFAQTPTTTAVQVSNSWMSDEGPESAIDRFVATVTAHESDDAASGTVGALFDSVQEGTIYNAEMGAEARGDDSFFVRYNDPNWVIDEYTIRFGPIVYEFRSEAVHYGGARDAFRLMEEVFTRVDETANTEESEIALLPTEAEAQRYGLEPRFYSPAVIVGEGGHAAARPPRQRYRQCRLGPPLPGGPHRVRPTKTRHVPP